MENLLHAHEARLTKWFALMGSLCLAVGLTLGRCTAPTPQPVMVTKVKVEEVEKIVTKFEKTNSNRECLAQALFAEARGETKAGAKAVGEVIMNRVKDTRYPHTICGVVRYKTVRNGKVTYHFSYQNKSDDNFYKTARVFADMHVTAIELGARERAYEIADMVMAGVPSLPSTSLNYHSTAVKPPWSDDLTKHKQVGAHIFYTGY